MNQQRIVEPQLFCSVQPWHETPYKDCTYIQVTVHSQVRPAGMNTRDAHQTQKCSAAPCKGCIKCPRTYSSATFKSEGRYDSIAGIKKMSLLSYDSTSSTLSTSTTSALMVRLESSSTNNFKVMLLQPSTCECNLSRLCIPPLVSGVCRAHHLSQLLELQRARGIFLQYILSFCCRWLQVLSKPGMKKYAV